MNGAKAGIQLIHAGRTMFSQRSHSGRAFAEKDGYFQVQPRALAEEEIDEIIEA